MDRTRPITHWIIILALLCGKGWSQQQSFRVSPSDTDVTEGQTAILRCEISNRAGAVQWAKDGFVLGYDPVIPGYPRYRIVGDSKKGEFNLRIENAQIEDDGEYQCQVGPTADNQAIRADARLCVLLAPTTVEFVERPTGGTIEIRQEETLDIACVVKGGKPAATIKWYRKNIEIRMDNAECSTEDIDGKRQNTKCRINLKPSPEDNGAIYACEGNHPALAQPIRAQIKLSVLYPPGSPEIEGYQEGEVIRMGDTVTLSCTSRGGNPLAQLVWFKNGIQIDYSYSTTSKEAINSYMFVVDATDNNAIYKCEASNSVSQEPLVTSVKLMVQFAPSKLTIRGNKEAKVGDNVTMVCESDKSNPAAEVYWIIGGLRVPSKSAVSASNEGGWLTISEVTVPVSDHDRTLMFSCYAEHQALGQTIVESTIVNILYPPNPPNIYGYNESVSLRAGALQRLTCFCMGGNPRASLSWFKGNNKIPSTNKDSGNLAAEEITIVAEESDNGAEYRCEASNSATPHPLSVSIRLSVLFPPSGVDIKIISTKVPKAGKKVTLQCDSSSSNPESTITWWRGGYLILGKTNGTFEAPHGGKSTRSILRLDVTSADDGAVYKCQATNEVLQQSVHDAITLSILYKPEFWNVPNDVINVLEGEVAVINMTARANPPAVNYTWTKKNSPGESGRFSANGPILNISEVKREHSGVYVCEARNEEGVTKANATLNVQYAPQITKITNTFMVEEGSNAHMECVVDANPAPENFVVWQRDGYDMSRTKQITDGMKSYLTIFSVIKDDSGVFNCVANNRIGEESKMSTTLIVKFVPVFNTAPKYQKAASEKGQTAQLVCQAEGAPKITFTWTKDAVPISVSAGNNKFRINSSQINLITWESVLLVSDVKTADYGPYECVARNEMGFSTTKIQLDGTSIPDTPLSLLVTNVSHNTVWLSWSPGFDGGLFQSFRIRYKKLDGLVYMYSDVSPPNTTEYGVNSLDLGTEYVFSIMAFNKLGESPYTKENIKAKTLSELPPSEQKTTLPPYMYEKGEIPRIIIIAVSVLGTSLLVLNIFLIVCFIQRRRKKRMEEAAESDQSSSKTAATIEMYAPSSYNGTVTGETLSSISEKSESYSDENSIDDYNDESTTKVAATTYLTERPETTVSTVFPADNSQYLTVRDANSGSRQNTLTRNQKPNNNQNIYEQENGTYADELRRNAYNQNLGDKVTTYTKAPVSPTKTPMRDGYFNMTPDPRYIPYPPVLTSPQRQQQTPILTTFNPNPAATNLNQSSQQNLPPELQGHLV